MNRVLLPNRGDLLHKRKATWSEENPDGRWRSYDYDDLRRAIGGAKGRGFTLTVMDDEARRQIHGLRLRLVTARLLIRK